MTHVKISLSAASGYMAPAVMQGVATFVSQAQPARLNTRAQELHDSTGYRAASESSKGGG